MRSPTRKTVSKSLFDAGCLPWYPPELEFPFPEDMRLFHTGGPSLVPDVWCSPLSCQTGRTSANIRGTYDAIVYTGKHLVISRRRSGIVAGGTGLRVCILSS